MAFTINAFNHKEWARFGLADYGDFADMATECNQGEDAFSGYGEWFFIPDEPLRNNDRVIYFGTWGNDHSPAHCPTPTPRFSTWTTKRMPPNTPSGCRIGNRSPSGRSAMPPTKARNNVSKQAIIAAHFQVPVTTIRYVRGQGWWFTGRTAPILLGKSFHDVQCSPDWALRTIT